MRRGPGPSAANEVLIHIGDVGIDAVVTPSPSATEAAVAGPVRVLDAGLGSDGRRQRVTALVENDSTEAVVVDVTFTVHDDAGGEEHTATSHDAVIRAGATRPVGADIDVPAWAGSLPVAAVIDSHEALGEDVDVELTTEDVRVDPDWGNRVHGQVTSSKDIENAVVSVICFDLQENIIGGGEVPVAAIAAGESVEFEAPVTRISDGLLAGCEAYGSPTLASF